MDRLRHHLEKGEGKEVEKRSEFRSYTAYGLRIHAALPLPELPDMADSAAPDVSILFSKLPPPPHELPDEGGGVLHTPEGVYFYWRQFGAFLVREGREILIDLLPGVDMQTVRLPLLGCVLGVLLHQRGLFTLHASAVSIDGAAVAFIGAKHAGKSTMAAALHARGHAMLTDDVLALDLTEGESDTARALPGFPQFKLWPESASALGEDLEKLSPLHPQLEKRALRPGKGFQKTPLPLKRIYVLSESPMISSERLSARDAFMQLISHSYAARFLGEAGAGPKHFRRCHRLVQQVPVYRLQRPCHLSQLPSVTCFVEDDCRSRMQH